MSRHVIPKHVVSEEEKALRLAICETLAEYESEYWFHHEGGHFVERVLKRLNGDYNRLGSALYLTLLGCCCRDDIQSTVPCKVRMEIADKILERYFSMPEVA